MVSDKACAVAVVIPAHRTTIVSFRGTKDPVDVLTDINFWSSPFTPLGWKEAEGASPLEGDDDGPGALRVHGGFKAAFESIQNKVTSLLANSEATENVIFVGHSMGGALAQLATVYFCEYRARYAMHPAIKGQSPTAYSFGAAGS
jgi:hypothetical protein